MIDNPPTTTHPVDSAATAIRAALQRTRNTTGDNGPGDTCPIPWTDLVTLVDAAQAHLDHQHQTAPAQPANEALDGVLAYLIDRARNHILTEPPATTVREMLADLGWGISLRPLAVVRGEPHTTPDDHALIKRASRRVDTIAGSLTAARSELDSLAANLDRLRTDLDRAQEGGVGRG